MPQLKQPTEDIKQFFLPSTASQPEADQAWVKMDVAPLSGGDIIDLLNSEDTPTVGTISGEMLAQRIKEWNFTDATSQPEPINVDRVRCLEREDLIYLLGQFNKADVQAALPDQLKKN